MGVHGTGCRPDQLSRLTSETQPLGAVSYLYDAAGRRTRLTYPGGLYIGYDVNVVGEVTALRENGAGSGVGVLAQYAYDDLGRRTSLTRGNGTTETYAYDLESRLASLVTNLAATTHDRTLSMSYNEADQILSRNNTNTLFAWSAPSSSTTYTDNGLNQYTTVGTTAQTYDLRGNLTTGGFLYDAYNRLTAGPNSAALVYDPSGRLARTQSSSSAATRFLYDGSDLIGEYNASGTLLRRYVHGPGSDEPIVWYEGGGTTDRRWLVQDELGTVVAVTNASGAATSVNKYDVYGVPGASNTGRFGFTSQVWLPEVGLYHYKARAYSPTLGRFLQTDPIGFDGGMNLYAYVGNDPLNATDPLGLAEFTQDADIVVYGKAAGGGEFGFWNWPMPRGPRGPVGVAGEICLGSCLFEQPLVDDTGTTVASTGDDIVVTARRPPRSMPNLPPILLRGNLWGLLVGAVTYAPPAGDSDPPLDGICERPGDFDCIQAMPYYPAAQGSVRRGRQESLSWSNNPACSIQYENDIAICRKLKSRSCWESASERLAYCNRTGEIGFPRRRR